VITIVLPAGNIPDMATVRKLTGQVQYTLRHEIKIYTHKDLTEQPVPVIANAGVKYLLGDRSVEAIPDTLCLAIDFKSPREATAFLDEQFLSGD
jgi:hypothetical protein